MKLKKIAFIFVFSLLLSLFAFAQNPKIKVGINFGASSLYGGVNISFENGFSVGYYTPDSGFIPAADFSENNVTITASGNSLSMTNPSGALIYQSPYGIGIDICPIQGESEIPYSKIGSIRYPEILSFDAYDNAITLINIVDSEIYFKGVLPSEVYPSWHEEALKAAAVATRTYTYHSISGKHSTYGIDVCATTCCQVYSGITRCQESTDKAVDDTANLVLTYNDKLITAVYHAISGGITETAAGAWGGKPENYPYLTVVETPFENYNEIARGHWKKVLYDEDFASLISSSSYSGKISSSIANISIDDPTPGYLNNVTLTDTLGSSITLKTSSQVRSFFSTLSANFTIGHVYMPQSSASGSTVTVLSADGKSTVNSSDLTIMTGDGKERIGGIRSAYFIDGKGYGHGVGLSQYGAQYAAKAGYTYDRILATYYPGTTIQDYTTLNQQTNEMEVLS